MDPDDKLSARTRSLGAVGQHDLDFLRRDAIEQLGDRHGGSSALRRDCFSGWAVDDNRVHFHLPLSAAPFSPARRMNMSTCPASITVSPSTSLPSSVAAL